MKNKLVLLLVVLLSVSGCQSTNKTEQIIKQKYETYYHEIMNNELFSASSSYFDLTGTINEVGPNKYRYDLIIDNPKVAMFSVNALVVENNRDLFSEQIDSVLPLAYSTSKLPINLMPFQVNLTQGYVKGVVLSGIVNELPVNLKVVVLWEDYGEIKDYKQFIELNLDLATAEPVAE